MKDWRSQAHVKWVCKYHVVIVPKYRKKKEFGRVRRQMGEILRQLCRQKGVELVEGKAASDHVHMLLSIPPKYSIAMIIGFLKGKSAYGFIVICERRKELCLDERSGHAGTASALWVWMRQRSRSTSKTRKNTSVTRNADCLSNT